MKKKKIFNFIVDVLLIGIVFSIKGVMRYNSL